MPTLGYDDFKRARRFPALDGIRAIAVLLVMTVHAGAHSDFRPWEIVNGTLGVTIFFVLSGFLITTLLLREQESRGRVSLKAFYVRRLMRLAPLYYLVLCVHILLILGTNLPESVERRADLMRKLPLFVFYMSEYAAAGRFQVFGQAWTLGIEEKFYFAWPSLAFLVLSRNRSRITAAIVLAGVLSVFALTDVLQILFSQSYASLFIGCALALLLNERHVFERVKFLGARSVQTICFTLAFLIQVLPAFSIVIVKSTSLYAAAMAVVIATAVIGERSIWTVILGSRVMTYIGQRSYAIYLVHVLATHVIDKTRIFPPHTTAAAIGAFAATLGLSLQVAEGLYRCIEGPCIRLGHAWSAALQNFVPQPAILRPQRLRSLGAHRKNALRPELPARETSETTASMRD